nr:MAG TPA: hypothetical protein [Caudoviricetes sp.]
MVKWLKIDKQDKTRQGDAVRRLGRSPFIIFRNRQLLLATSEDASRCRTIFSCSLGKTEIRNHTKICYAS